MRWVALVVIAPLVGCGRIGFDLYGDAGDLPSGPWARVFAGGPHTCAVKTDGSTWCFGRNYQGDLGTPGSFTVTTPPTQLAGSWAQIGPTNGDATCGIQTDGSLWCWGNNNSGQLGDGTLGAHPTPYHVGSDVDWSEVETGARHACARKTDQTVWCWGDNGNHQYSAASTSSRVPLQLSGNFSSMSVGADHSCFVTTAGVLLCIGFDAYGELGENMSGFFQTVFTQVGTDTDWALVSTTESATCALKTDHSLWCWGANVRGKLGTGDATWRTTPTRVGTDTDWDTVHTGPTHACAGKPDGSVWCFGATVLGQLAGKRTADALVPTQIATATSYAVGGQHTCTVDSRGALRCTGGNGFGEVGAPPSSSTSPRMIDAGPWTNLVGYRFVSCARSASTGLSCWGRNDNGELGDGALRYHQDPFTFDNLDVIAPGLSTSAALGGGQLYGWGTNFVTGAIVSAPAVIDVSTTWSQVTGGENHACALNGNAISCWGNNLYGQLGTGNNMSSGSLAPVAGMWTLLAAGQTHTCAVSTGGNVECWGDNRNGEIGNNSLAAQNAPVPVVCGVPCVGTVKRLAMGDAYSCMLMTTGALFCWGANDYGEAGNGSFSNAVINAQAAGTTTDWRDVAAGDAHMCGIKMDGSLWCWGHGDYGQLGVGASVSSIPVPMQIGTDKDWQTVVPLHHSTCALKADGSRWCWGINYFGIYGDGHAWLDDWVVVAP